VRFRPAGSSDDVVLRRMLTLAATWRDAHPRVANETLLADQLLARYVVGWPRPGDVGVVAEGDEGRAVGAVWYRTFSADEPGFGFVSPMTPELSVAVEPDARGAGIGGALLERIIDEARVRGVHQLSLSVEPDNPAIRLYERRGFTPVSATGSSEAAEAGESVTMGLSLVDR